jgi:dTDP-4-dehydrorhamnose reductase
LNLIIIGASGYIGKRLLLTASKLIPSSYGTSSTGKNGLTVFNLNSPLSFNYSSVNAGDVIFLTAAISAPDACAHDFEHSWGINVVGTSEFIDRITSRGARVIFFSSDTVFGERCDSFDETMKNMPAGEYAEMKAEIESRFSKNHLFKAIRLSYVFSKDDKFTKYLIACASQGMEAEIFDPFSRSIIYRDDVVDGALALAASWDAFPQKLINFGGPTVLSRLEYAECLRGEIVPNLQYKVTDPGEEFFKNRPRTIAMLSPILPILLGRPARTLAESARIEFGKI